MVKKIVLFVALVLCFSLSAEAQSKKKKKKGSGNSSPTPASMFEVGVHGGYYFISGDIPTQGGYMGGLHVRKALDYIFSIRVDLMYGQTNGEETVNPNRSYSNTFIGGDVSGVISLNSLRFDKPVRKTNLYALVGGGVNSFETTYSTGLGTVREDTLSAEITPHIKLGLGFAYRISERINIAIEHNAGVLFGNRADLIDGFDKQGEVKTTFRDITNYTSLRVNINLGNSSKKSEPLYWINPLDVVLQDISELKERPALSLEDTDEDGVIDAIDQELDTPPNVPVDTKGRTLDSDRDGVPDFKDKEPFYTPRPGEIVDAEGIVTNPQGGGSGGGVTEERVKELIDEALQNLAITNPTSNAFAEMFLPMIHFGASSTSVKYSDYGTLASVSRVMKGNPTVRLVVTGFTDQTGEEARNNQLSYDRAKAVIDHLVQKHGIERGRLILQWKGQEEALVPLTSSYMNRRVEFKVATDEYEMDPPSTSTESSNSGY